MSVETIRRRVSDLAREFGIEVQAVLKAAESVGIHGKRPQSQVSEDEARQIRMALGRSADGAGTIAIGSERRVVHSDGQTVVERRVSTTVIRRRPSSVQSPPPTVAKEAPASDDKVTSPLPSGRTAGKGLLAAPVEPLAAVGEPIVQELMPTMPDVASSPGSLAGLAPVTEVSGPEAAFIIPEPETTRGLGLTEQTAEQVVAAQEVHGEASLEPTAVSAVSEQAQAGEGGAISEALALPPGASAAPVTERSRGPVVLGRIDLSRQRPQPARARAARERPGLPVPERAPAVAPPVLPTEDRPRKKKRRVVERGEAMEQQDFDRWRNKQPKKKKPSPGQEIQKTEITTPRAHKRVIRMAGDSIKVRDLAREMAVRDTEVVRKLLDLGLFVAVNHPLDFDTAALVADSFGFTVEKVVDNLELRLEEEPSTPGEEENLQPRPPVVTVMGHVDHGKTSLLDAIRQTNVTAQEAGGITQHIGAYTVEVQGRKVTFLDTPGHEAFTAMRARGAKVTDIVILVVAADDGVMPQTVEAIDHAKAAGVPILVAVNKIDKPGANVEKVTRELMAHGLVSEEFHGDTTFVKVSAKTKEGLPELLEMILLHADVLELKANPDKRARGTIIEAKLDRGRGPVATVLIQDGTLRQGDPFVCGPHYGRVRALIDDKGQRVDSAGPSTPVEILGFESVPDVGSKFVVAPDEATARQIAEQRKERLRQESLNQTARLTLEELNSRVQAGEVKELRVVLRADVQGSVEALTTALKQLSTEEVKLSILHAAVGSIKESDVDLAMASNAVIIGFNVRPESRVAEKARQHGVEIRLYDVIYNAIKDVRDALQGLLEPTREEILLGRAEVREVFRIPNVGSVAGACVAEGKIVRNADARLVRDGIVVHTGRIASLRRFKDDVREVVSGQECGIGLHNFQDIKVGDVIEAFQVREVARQLSGTPGRAAGGERRG